MGHDLGHTPFGHSGEAILNRIYSKGFRHNVQSLRVVDCLEISGSKRGMNLTMEVRDGILNHTGPDMPFTLEGQIVKTSDRIAYINHDIDDAIRSGVITAEDLPAESIEILGSTHKQRIDTLVKDMISFSDGKPFAALSDEKLEAMNNLRSFMFANVYHNREVKQAEDIIMVEKIICSLFEYYMTNPRELPAELLGMEEECDLEELVKDHIAGMTDRYAYNKYRELFMKTDWK